MLGVNPPHDPNELDPRLADLCRALAELSGELETETPWPAEQLRLLGEAGVLGWLVPPSSGGGGLDQRQLVFGYEQLAAACLVTTFVLTQRNAALQRIVGSSNTDLQDDLLTQLCHAGTFVTVGISHLTTSRQHLSQPAVSAEETADGWELHGTVPWVTGGAQADYVVTGGTLGDGRQLLVAIDTSLPGVTPGAPAPLLALDASQTGPIVLDSVRVPKSSLVAGPVEGVMSAGRTGGTGSLTTSALALGATDGALTRLAGEAGRRPDLEEILNPLRAEWQSIRTDMYAAIAGADGPDCTSESIRQRSNSLVLRATQAHLAASKGAGFAKGHPAERAVREAMFFLVWSCPQPVVTANLRQFACLAD